MSNKYNELNLHSHPLRVEFYVKPNKEKSVHNTKFLGRI
jgi:hypothetical protein